MYFKKFVIIQVTVRKDNLNNRQLGGVNIYRVDSTINLLCYAFYFMGSSQEPRNAKSQTKILLLSQGGKMVNLRKTYWRIFQSLRGFYIPSFWGIYLMSNANFSGWYLELTVGRELNQHVYVCINRLLPLSFSIFFIRSISKN